MYLIKSLVYQTFYYGKILKIQFVNDKIASKNKKMGEDVMTHKEDREVLELEAVQGGTGILKREALITPEQWGQHCGLFAEVTLVPGAVLGYHEHHGETETYYITKGNGIYNENGKFLEVKAGDVTFCEDGKGHGMENTGSSELTFIALILKK